VSCKRPALTRGARRNGNQPKGRTPRARTSWSERSPANATEHPDAQVEAQTRRPHLDHPYNWQICILRCLTDSYAGQLAIEGFEGEAVVVRINGDQPALHALQLLPSPPDPHQEGGEAHHTRDGRSHRDLPLVTYQLAELLDS
jgi:hypothetical protein